MLLRDAYSSAMALAASSVNTGTTHLAMYKYLRMNSIEKIRFLKGEQQIRTCIIGLINYNIRFRFVGAMEKSVVLLIDLVIRVVVFIRILCQSAQRLGTQAQRQNFALTLLGTSKKKACVSLAFGVN
jgi:hypothetical protein